MNRIITSRLIVTGFALTSALTMVALSGAQVSSPGAGDSLDLDSSGDSDNTELSCTCEGDVDGNGTIEPLDALRVQQCINGPNSAHVSGCDVNCNNTVDLVDARAVRCHDEGGSPYSCCCTFDADVDGNGAIEVFDAIRIQQCMNGTHPDNIDRYDCDVNCDGEIDELDLTATVCQAAGGEPYECFCGHNADIDGNGTVDQDDVQLFEEYMRTLPEDFNLAYYDINCDGMVDDEDLDEIVCQSQGHSPTACSGPLLISVLPDFMTTRAVAADCSSDQPQIEPDVMPSDIVIHAPTTLTISLDIDEPMTDVGIGGLVFDFMADPGLELVKFSWMGDLGDLENGNYFNNATLPDPETAYFGPVDTGVGLPFDVAEITVVSHDFGVFELCLNMEFANDTDFDCHPIANQCFEILVTSGTARRRPDDGIEASPPQPPADFSQDDAAPPTGLPDTPDFGSRGGG